MVPPLLRARLGDVRSALVGSTIANAIRHFAERSCTAARYVTALAAIRTPLLHTPFGAFHEPAADSVTSSESTDEQADPHLHGVSEEQFNEHLHSTQYLKVYQVKVSEAKPHREPDPRVFNSLQQFADVFPEELPD